MPFRAIFRHAILCSILYSTCYFMQYSTCHFVQYSTCHFVQYSTCHFVQYSTCHFVQYSDMPFCAIFRHAILCNMQTCHLVEYSDMQFRAIYSGISLVLVTIKIMILLYLLHKQKLISLNIHSFHY